MEDGRDDINGPMESGVMNTSQWGHNQASVFIYPDQTDINGSIPWGEGNVAGRRALLGNGPSMESAGKRRSGEELLPREPGPGTQKTR